MEKRARTLVVVQEGDLSFFCPYEPGAKEKMKADRNTDNRPTLSAFRAVFIFSFACGDSRKVSESPEGSLKPARRTTAPYPSPPKSDGAAQRPPSLPSPSQKRWAPARASNSYSSPPTITISFVAKAASTSPSISSPKNLSCFRITFTLGFVTGCFATKIVQQSSNGNIEVS